jgi:hypothetical protein
MKELAPMKYDEGINACLRAKDDIAGFSVSLSIVCCMYIVQTRMFHPSALPVSEKSQE